MAEIVLGIGTSHAPMLNATPEEWSRYEAREPTLKLLDRDGRPATYEALVMEAAGRYESECTREKLAERHAQAQDALDRLATEIDRARLDALIVVGDDQKELFLDDALPALLVYQGETVTHAKRPPKAEWEDWFAAIQARYYPSAGARERPVARALARHLTERLVEQAFDVAVAERPPRGEGVGHAFAFVHQRLLRELAVPVVPVFLNAYYPPNQPPPARCYALGRGIRAAVASYPPPARVGVLASGGLTHFAVDAPFDGEIVRALRDKDADGLMRVPPEKLRSGNSEIRNWIAAAGALEHLPLAWLEYVPAYRTPAGTGVGLCFAAWRA